MRKTFLIVLCAMWLGAASTAFASGTSPTQGAYSGQGAQQVSRAQNGVKNTNASSLPFTGLNVGVVSIVAVGLLGTGLILRRRVGSDRS